MPQRSTTGGHTLLPASNASAQNLSQQEIPLVPTRTFLSWTFGRGTAIWRIWPAVLLHTAFAAGVVTISLKTRYKLGIPNVLLTLLGVVIGFVISYRAMSGYDRYWQGRSSWSDVIRTSRTLGRLVWFHIPLRYSLPNAGDVHEHVNADESNRSKQREMNAREKEVHRLMAEKRMALDLIEGFAVALKHHLRGEKGIYYEDLYPLIKPLHMHEHGHPSQPQPQQNGSSTTHNQTGEASTSTDNTFKDPVIPPINSYGSLSAHKLAHTGSSVSLASTSSSTSSSPNGERQPLLSSAVVARKRRRSGLVSSVSRDLIPFSGLVSDIAQMFSFRRKRPDPEANNPVEDGEGELVGRMHAKHRPRIAGGGENIPLEIVRSLSRWMSVLEERGCVPGNTLGGMFGCLNAFEDSLASLEKILTTPLPFVFSVHINTVWLYLFALPFQLVDQFLWYTIPGVGIAAFIYLGFVATGEEVEQPFGYDENDLDLDLFCHEVIHRDIEHLKRTEWRNVWIGTHHSDNIEIIDDDRCGKHGRVETLFGWYAA